MSRSEVLRLYDDVKLDPELGRQLQSGAQGLGMLTENARQAGYDISIDDLKGYIVESSHESLSDERLAEVAAAGSTFSFAAISAVVLDPASVAIATATSTFTVVVVL